MKSTLADQLSDTSLVKLFLDTHAVRSAQTPRSFYLWSIMTAIAAMATDKFSYFKFPTSPMMPNLFTFLVAPSGVGKGTAINAATDYLKPYKEHLRMFVGRCTHSKWMEFVVTPRGPSPWDNGRDPSIVSTPGFLVTEELAWCLSEGQRAREFLKMMTGAYTQTGRDFEEMTQQFGYHSMENPCWNWLAGSTETWLLEAIGMANILSGFASRTIWLIEDYDLSKLCSWPIYPPDFSALQRRIEDRIEEIVSSSGGELILAPGARFQLDKWYGSWAQQAQNEGERALLPLYMRGHDLAIKLAMILRIADFDKRDPYRYAIKSEEVLQATIWVESLMLVHYPRLLKIAYKSKDQEIGCADELEEVIKSFNQGECNRAMLFKRAHAKGLTTKAVENAIKSLMERRLLELVPGPGGRGGYFCWCEDEKGKKK